MKTVILLALLSASALVAQPPPADKPSDAANPGNGTAELRTKRAVVAPTTEPKFSGAVVEAKRVGNPLKLLDPRAPGDPMANVSRDPITGRAQGIKLFAIRW
jgi:hypothetical protein